MKKLNQKIDEIKKDGTLIYDSPILAQFNDYAKKLGLDVVFSIFDDLNKSKTGVRLNDGTSVSVPIIKIFVNKENNQIINNIDPINSNWNGKFVNTEKLKDKWNVLVKEYNYPENYKNEHLLILIYSLESIVLCQLVYVYKDDVKKIAKELPSKYQPEFIFSSSKPSFNIIFKDQKHLDLFMSNYATKFTKSIQILLKEKDTFNYYKEDKVDINYLQRNMEIVQKGQLYRED